MIAHLVDIAQIVARQDDRLLGRERLDQIQHRSAGFDVETERRFVPDQEIGFVDQAGGDGEASGHAVRKTGDRLARDGEQIDGANQVGEPRLAGIARQAEQPRHVIEVRDRRHALGELRIGRDVADLAADRGGVRRHPFAEDLHPPGRLAMQAEADAQKRGLTGAVGAQETQDGARLDAQCHVVERDISVLVDLGQSLSLDDQIDRLLGHTASADTPPVSVNAGL